MLGRLEAVPTWPRPPACSRSAICMSRISGTWRDTEGRLIWGVNDFDEVARMPYAVDLVRLVTSLPCSPSGERAYYRRQCPRQRYRRLLGIARIRRQAVRTRREFITPDLRAMAMGASTIRSSSGESSSASRALCRRSAFRGYSMGGCPRVAAETLLYPASPGWGSLGRPRCVGIAQCNGGLGPRRGESLASSVSGLGDGRPKDHALADAAAGKR